MRSFLPNTFLEWRDTLHESPPIESPTTFHQPYQTSFTIIANPNLSVLRSANTVWKGVECFSRPLQKLQALAYSRLNLLLMKQKVPFWNQA